MPRIDRAILALVPVALLGTATSAWAAAANFTTLNSSVVTLTSHAGSALTPAQSATLTGPANDLFFGATTNIGDGSLGNASWIVQSLDANTDQFGADYRNSGGSTFTIEMLWNVTFSGRVKLTGIDLAPPTFGTLTYTPAGGSATTLTVNTELAAGTYDIVWNYDETTPRTGALQFFEFVAVANPVPGAGVAAIAACGFGGVLRRRRR